MKEIEIHNNTENSFNEILILYGSQTGTAKFAAEDLQRELFKFNFTSKLSEMDSYNFLNLPEENFIIFIISTTGYGEFPSNSKNFWNFLMRKDLPEDSLGNVNYTVFGLGDSSYEKFNHCAKLLNSRLNKLSANLYHPVALGDEQHDFGYEAEFDPWVKSVIEELLNYFPEKVEFTANNRNVFDFFIKKVDFEVEVFNEKFIRSGNYDEKEEVFKNLGEQYHGIKENQELWKLIENNKIGVIKENEIITSEDSFKKVFNLKLEIAKNENKMSNNFSEDKDIEGYLLENIHNSNNCFQTWKNNDLIIEKINTEIFYNFADEKIKNFSRKVRSELKENRTTNLNNLILLPGDSALFFPENEPESVLKFMKITNLKGDDYLIFKHKSSNFHNGIMFPYIINAEEFVRKWLNINGCPNRFFCYIASLFTEELIYKEKLELFSSKSSVKNSF
jgi:sulfite reductase alpha subunit-like flavoprotein